MGLSVSKTTSNAPQLLQLPPEVIYNILENISLEDISNLCRSCSHLSRVAQSFLWSKITPQLLTNWQNFVEYNKGMLTEQEKPLAHIKDMQDILDIRFVYRILSVQRDLIGEVMRLGCLGYEVYVVTEKGRLYNFQMKTIWNDRLGRNVMFVDRVRWLQMTCTWQVDCPGKYKISVRLRLEKNFTWPHRMDQPTVWSISYPKEDDQGLLEVEVDREWWMMVRRKEIPIGRLLVKGEVDGWVNITFPVIDIYSSGQVVIDLKDTVCNNWKGGLSFDYFQICRIS